MQRISGRDVDVRLSTGIIARCDQVNLDLSAGTKGVTSGGYPDGWVFGTVTGTGDIEIDPEELLKLMDDAAAAGSYEEMDAVDFMFYANNGETELKVEAFGCKLDLPDFKANKKGGDKLTHTIKFEITDPQFVHINDIPLVRQLQTTG